MNYTQLLIAATTIVATNAHAGTVTSAGKDLVISTDGGVKIHTTDKTASFQLGGRLQWDYDSTDSDTGRSTDLDVRRARIYVKGTLQDWAYKVQFNIAENGDSGGDAEDLYLRYTGWGKQAYLTIGKQKEPFGFNQLNSSKDISLLERDPITEQLTEGRNAGVQLSGKGQNWTYGVGVFEAEGDGGDDFDNIALTGRVSYNPVNTDDSIVHVGAAFSTRDADSSANDVDRFGLEVAGTMGSLHAQAEYIAGEWGDDNLNGYYVQVGYIITGEKRPYKDGVFKRVKPAKESGAWEVVARVSEGDGRYSDVGAGSGDGSQVSIGANWYATNAIRFGVSYMDGENDDTGVDGDEFRVRAQIAF